MPIGRDRLVRVLCVVGIYAALVVLGQIVSDWALDRLGMTLMPSTQGTVHRIVMAVTLLYVLMLAVPFMPGVEIGFGLMTILGPGICLLVYVSTVVALMLAFSIGRLVRPRTVIVLFDFLGLGRGGDLMRHLAPLSVEERLQFLLDRVPGGSTAFLLRYRYLALAVMLNLPGNAVIGGGGGIAMTAGLIRLFTFPAFAATVALAVAPLPLVFYLAGGFG